MSYLCKNIFDKNNIMKKIALFACASLFATVSFAQQALWGGAQLVSPQVNADNTVTFRYKDVKAKSVQITGDFLPETEIEIPNFGKMATAGVADLVEKDGVWEFTTPAPLASEYYTYQFIVDGLKTTDPANVYINRDVATVTNYFIIKNAPGDKGDLYSINKVPHGTVRKMWYYSKELGTNRRVTVYTPAGYETSGKKYPVFYLLHGAGGDEEAWYTQGRTTQILDNLIATGKAEPMIVVMTNGNAWQTAAPGESAEGFAQPSMGMGSSNVQVKEAAFELHFPDVINFIQKNFRTYTDKKHRAIAGLSMGSFHSENISKYYPTMFNYVGLFSGANVGGGLGNAPATSDVYTDFDAKMAVQFSAKNKPALYMICCGKTDFVKKGVDDLRAYMTEHNYPFEYMETEGGHIWRNWRVYLSTFAPRLFK